MDRDDKRKTAINAMYYALEEGYYDEERLLSRKNRESRDLPWIDPKPIYWPIWHSISGPKVALYLRSKRL